MVLSLRNSFRFLILLSYGKTTNYMPRLIFVKFFLLIQTTNAYFLISGGVPGLRTPLLTKKALASLSHRVESWPNSQTGRSCQPSTNPKRQQHSSSTIKDRETETLTYPTLSSVIASSDNLSSVKVSGGLNLQIIYMVSKRIYTTYCDNAHLESCGTPGDS